MTRPRYNGFYVRLNKDGYEEMVAPVHVLKAEKALGRKLPAGSVVHHVNLDRGDNSPGNLVILQNQKEHAQLHARMAARSTKLVSIEDAADYLGISVEDFNQHMRHRLREKSVLGRPRFDLMDIDRAMESGKRGLQA